MSDDADRAERAYTILLNGPEIKIKLEVVAMNFPDALRRAADQFQGGIGVHTPCPECGTRRAQVV